MPDPAPSDRRATRDEVVAERRTLRALAAEHGLSEARIDDSGTVIVHTAAPGYRDVHRYAARASAAVGAWVTVITDDVPAAEKTLTEAL